MRGNSHAHGASTYNGPQHGESASGPPMTGSARPTSSVTAVGTLEPPPHWWHRV